MQSFLFQFINVHLLLFGGATAYNSFWDKDEGPIGGLQNPPKMQPWMWSASLILQGVGLLIAIPQGLLYSGIYLGSILFFWLYSTGGNTIPRLVARKYGIQFRTVGLSGCGKFGN